MQVTVEPWGLVTPWTLSCSPRGPGNGSHDVGSPHAEPLCVSFLIACSSCPWNSKYSWLRGSLPNCAVGLLLYYWRVFARKSGSLRQGHHGCCRVCLCTGVGATLGAVLMPAPGGLLPKSTLVLMSVPAS